MNLTIPSGDFGAYIFDCDGTLADSMPLHYRAWIEVLGLHNVELPEALFYEMGGIPTEEIIRILNGRHGTTMDPVAVAAHKEEIYISMLEEVMPIEPVIEFVHEFQGKLPIAVASGGQRAIVHKTLNSLGILEKFDAVVCAEDYKRGKPHPDPFLEAARQLNVPPPKCVVFEDSQIGIRAAEAAGMAWVLVPPPERK